MARENAGGLLSSEIKDFREPSWSALCEGNKSGRAKLASVQHPAESENLACVDTFRTKIERPRKEAG